MDFSQSEKENKKEFIAELIGAGWSKKDAEAEWQSIQEDDESGYDGP